MKTAGLLTAACLCFQLLCFCARQSAQPYTEQSLQRYIAARNLYSEQRLEEALLLLVENHGSAPRFSANSFLIGKIYYFLENHEQAERYWQHTLEFAPHHLDTGKWLARLYLQQGRIDEAEALLADALSISSEDAELLILMAKVRRGREDLSGAIELYLKSQSFSERLCEASIDLAEIYCSFGLTDRAREELQRALVLLGGDSSLGASIASALEQLEGGGTRGASP
ncbi:MAG: tetratricopeptide repeat protein [Spirochaetales bacterium]|nr:tetratricopeptide repeat protein [Spirochaetales bacterium]